MKARIQRNAGGLAVADGRAFSTAEKGVARMTLTGHPA